MQIVRLADTKDMDPWVSTWNTLAGDIPLLRWEWLGSWWEHYGDRPDYELCVLMVRDDNDRVIGFAPWYLDKSARIIRFLGSGKVCTDYLTLLAAADDREAVVSAVAYWLHQGHAIDTAAAAWDQVELVGGVAGDPCLQRLAEAVKTYGLTVHTRPGMDIYYRPLPATWDEYLMEMSKNARQQRRRLCKRLDGDARIHVTTCRQSASLDELWPVVVDLHQRRRHSLGSTGCFDHPPFGDFLRTATARMLDAGLAEIVLLSIDDRPVAMEYALTGPRSYYTYQSGIDPDFAAESPGRLILAHCFREAIAAGRREFDFMRGDEEYKTRWRAVPRQTVDIRIVAPRVSARLRHQFWLTGTTIKDWVRGGVRGTN